MPRDESIDPLAQLERCHRRLEDACAALTTAVEKRDIETISDVASFFARQITRHEADEDTSLFPRLSWSGASPPTPSPQTTTREDAGRCAPAVAVAVWGPELARDLARLGEEHVVHGALQRRLDDAVSGRIDPELDMWAELRAVAIEIGRSYREHIALEETRVFPAARAILTADDLAAIRAEMDARRGR